MIIFGGWDGKPYTRACFSHLCDRCKYVTFVQPNEDGEYICKRCGKEEE